MKKQIVVFISASILLLSSCGSNGKSVSKVEALDIMNKIIEKIDNPSFVIPTKLTYNIYQDTTSETYATDNFGEIDDENSWGYELTGNYYHDTTSHYNDSKEYWTYARGEKNYQVYKNVTGSTEEDIEKYYYEVPSFIHTEDTISDYVSQSKQVATKLKSILSEEIPSGVNFTATSKNETNLIVNISDSTHSSTYSFDNNLLILYKYKDAASQTLTEFSWGDVAIFYPNLNEYELRTN